MSANVDGEHQGRLSQAIYRAIIAESIDEDSGVAILRAQEIVGALLAILALIMSTSEAPRSPTSSREACAVIAKRLRRKIAAAKQAGDLSSLTIIREAADGRQQ
jgi:hypothetical protein